MKRKNIEIVQREAKILRNLAQTVPVAEIKTAKIQKIIADMKLALDAQDDGVAIAAPQIDIPLRIFVVSKKAEMIMKGIEKIDDETKKDFQDVVYINPEIKKISKTKTLVDEGCLSVRYAYGKVERANKATVTAYDENGKKFTRGGSGLLAQIFQHETDHLNGVLFTDKAVDLKEQPPLEPENYDK
ncbi:MAG: peptide deformylase [Candidatus Paceibacterota bacterium]